MRKILLNIVVICFCMLPLTSFGQNFDKATPRLIKSVRKGSQMIPVSPEQSKGKPLDSEIFLQTLKPLPSSPFAKAQIGFSKHQKDVSLKLAQELGDETLFANMVFSDEWSDLAIYEIPYGIYSFTATDKTEFNMHYENIGLNCNTGVYAYGKYYGIHPITLFGAMTGVGYFVIDTETWETEKNFINNEAGYEDIASNMTFDPTTNTIFALRYNEDLTGYNWAKLDTASFTFENIAEWPGKFTAITLSTTPDGKIYGIGSNGNLYTYDKADGTPTLIGATGVYPSNYAQSAVYNGHTGKLLWAAITYTGSYMYAVDLSTGEASKLFAFENDEELVGMYTKSTTAMDNAPAAIDDLNVSFDAPGSLTGNINFTTPTLSYSGSTVTENLHVVTKIDGNIVEELNLAPGTSHNLSFDLTNENHTFSVITSNSVGISPLANLTRFVGYDNPKAVSNLSFSIDEDGNGQLAWDAPQTGIYDGYLDANSMFYKVVRYPDEVTVADNLTNSSFSETMPTLVARYYYEVTAYNGSDKEGLTATTDEVVFGDGFEPPYTQKFEDDNSLDYFNIIDTNGDGTTWQQLTSVIAYWTNNYDNIDGNDWVITPAMALKAGYKYKLVFSTKALWSPAIESMKVSLGTSQTDTETFTTELWNNPAIDFYDYTDQTVEFSVDTDGKYYIGFYAYTPAATGNGLYIDDISVQKIGAFEAPSKVSDLTITPEANGELNATISFTAPLLNVTGQSLSELSQIDIFRNGDLTNSVHTFTNPTPGDGLTWVDENVPYIGFNSYTVVSSNTSGESEEAEAREFIGIYSAPYSETFDEASAIEFYTFQSLLAETSNWSYNEYSQCMEGANWSNIADEWVYLPTLKLESNTVYEFSLDYKSYGLGTFDFAIGNSKSPESQTVVAEFSKEPIYSMTTTTALFSTDEDGKYIPALHLAAGESYYYFFVDIDNIKVTKMASTKSPGAIQNLILTADENGNRSVNISFNAPSEAYNGGTLESISKIEIYKSSDIIATKTFENPAMGEVLSFTDNNVSTGYVKYAFLTENEYGQGATVVDSVFVGADIPNALTNITIKADATNANSTISWEAPEGENGGYIDYTSLTYNVYAYDLNTSEFSLVKENVTDTQCDMQENITGELQLLYYAVSPVLNGYEAEPYVGHVVLGTPYTLPFKESFGEMNTSPWVTAGSTNTVWTITSEIYTADGLTVTSQDNDEGMIFFYNPYGNGIGYLEIPKVELYKKNVASNVLRFWVYQSPEIATSNSLFYLEISANDNEFETLTEEITLNEGLGWTPYTINLDTYKSVEYIKIRMYAYIDSYAEAFLIDNINIYSIFPEDLTASSISGPEVITAGEEVEFTVEIQNVGSNGVSGTAYTVELYNDDKMIATQDGIDLTAEETASYIFTINADVTEIGNTWNLTAKVNYSADQVTSNNTGYSIQVEIEASELPAVDNLSAITSQGEVTLIWNEPNLDYSIPDLEGWESQTALSIDNFNNWKTIDLDQQITVVVSGLDYTNANEAMAYQIWNISEAGADTYSEYLSAHSGNQCIISWCSAGALAADESPVDAANNDWLISDEITPDTGLSFWAKQPSADYGNETFEIWTSSTSNNVDDFNLFDSKQLTGTGWTYYSFELPTNAKYFAIRHTSSCFALMIDDIEFTPVNAQVYQYNLLGYNVYNNGSKINSAIVTETTFTDTPSNSGSNSYTVNASYETGISDLSNSVVIDFTSTDIDGNSLQQGQITGGKGQITARNLEGKEVNVYTVSGQLIKSFLCDQNIETYSLTRGVYVVTVKGNTLTSKIIVY